MTLKTEEAKMLIIRIRQEGYNLSLANKWIRLTPTPPVALTMEMMDYSNEIAELIENGF